jgi:hypothetical protein
MEARQKLVAERQERVDFRSAPGAAYLRAGKLSMARLHELGREKGISAATLRNYFVSLSALEEVAEPWARKQLETRSAVGVAAFGRWYRRDPQSALAFLARNPHASPEAFLQAEREFRVWTQGAQGSSRGVRFDSRLISSITTGQVLASLLGRHAELLRGPELLLTRDIAPALRFVGLDGVIERGGDFGSTTATEHPIGFVELPRFELLQSYGKRAREIWQRASSAATAAAAVLVVFPGPAARRRLLAALPQPVSDPPGAFSGVPHSPTVNTGPSACPIFYRAAEGSGLIIFTSPLTLLRDLGH